MGEDWILPFQGQGAYGRIVYLEPMSWAEDGWLVIGWDPDGNGRGEPVARWRRPAVTSWEAGLLQPVAIPPSSDEFEGASLGLQWQWQANPETAWWSLAEAPGHLRLFPQPLPDGAVNLWPVASLLLQKPTAEAFQVTTEMHFAPTQPGARAGLIVFGTDYAWIGIENTTAGRAVVVKTAVGAREGGEEELVGEIPAPDGPVQLRVTWRASGLCEFSVLSDGESFTPLGPIFAAKPGRWVGV